MLTPRRPTDPVATPALSTRTWLVTNLTLMAVFAAAGTASVNNATGLSDLWAVPATSFIGMTLVMDTTAGLRQPRVWLFAAAEVVAFCVGAIAAGTAISAAIRMGMANVGVGMLAVLAYRWRGLGRSWIPQRVEEAGWLMAALLLPLPLGLVLGAFPGTEVGGGHDLRIALWNLAKQYTFLTVGANTVLPLVYALPGRNLPHEGRRWLPLFIVATAACVSLPYIFPLSPLAWMFVVPGVWAGMSMPTRPAVVTVLLIGVGSARVPYPLFLDSAFGAIIVPPAFVDLAFAFLSHLTLVILVFRYHTARLSDEVAAQADAEAAQNELLTVVYQSMSDGLLLADAHGRVAMSNAAAAELAEGRAPTEAPPNTVDRVDRVDQVDQVDQVDRVDQVDQVDQQGKAVERLLKWYGFSAAPMLAAPRG